MNNCDVISENPKIQHPNTEVVFHQFISDLVTNHIILTQSNPGRNILSNAIALTIDESMYIDTVDVVCQVISRCNDAKHYYDVIMGTMSSQITSLTIIYSAVYSRRRTKKTSKLRATGLCVRNSPIIGEFLAQRASNAENVSIWWRHYVWTENWNAVAFDDGSSLIGTKSIPELILTFCKLNHKEHITEKNWTNLQTFRLKKINFKSLPVQRWWVCSGFNVSNSV